MSDGSLLTGVYANVEAYATLVDKVIERLRSEGSNPSDRDQQRLANLLIDAGDQGRASRSLEALLLDTLLRNSAGGLPLKLKQIGEQLLVHDVDKTCHRQLEELAKELEEERAQVAGRLRGR